MEKINCWDYMRCGRGLDGSRTGTQGICPAATFAPFNRVNSGSAAGRVCWAVDNTLCSGKASGHFSKKLEKCIRCVFYKEVLEQEGDRILLTIDLLKLIDTRVNSRPSGYARWPYVYGEAGDP